MRPPFVLDHADGLWRARPDGAAASSRLLDWWADGRPLPDGFRWAPADPRDPPADSAERVIAVDQTNHSVVVGEQVVVKWHTTALVGPHPAPERLRLLAGARFAAMPAVWCSLEWRTPDQHWVPVATAVDLIPAASDGWTWCLHEARTSLGLLSGPERPFAADLGSVTAQMHLALADGPSGPVATHGDYHVGQILRDDTGSLYVLDFDGNPTLSPQERVAHRPAAYDVAGMLLSLENVGHVVRHYAPEVDDDVVLSWTDRVQAEFLASYLEGAPGLLDRRLLPQYVDDQIQRELVYATAYLPSWRYVPEAALRRRGVL